MEKKFIRRSRWIFLFSFLLNICFPFLVSFFVKSEYSLVISLPITITAFPFTLGFFISSFQLRYKEYSYQGKLISVYAGWCNNYLKIDDEKFDEHTSSIFRKYPVVLSCITDSGEKIQATISTSNHISLKVNDKLIQNNS